MHFLMVCDAYPPMRTSCAVQMHGLAKAFLEEGYQVTVITPESTLKKKLQISYEDGIKLVQVKAFKTKDVNYLYRTFSEFINPFLMWLKLKKSPQFMNVQYNGVIWYSPTIFWSPLIIRLKKYFRIKGYLILRDIFPDWAVDLGLMKKGMAYRFFKYFEFCQYLQADFIGVQSPNNLLYFKGVKKFRHKNTEVLWNWFGDDISTCCSINLSHTKLANKKILVYAGNMGVAQAMDQLLDIAQIMSSNENIGFVFVGRGSEVERLKWLAHSRGLSNLLFFDEIPSSELPGLYRQCHAGLLSLDPRLSSNNIPGKFLSYLQNNLPVIAVCNSNNDLKDLFNLAYIGVFIEGTGKIDAHLAAKSIEKVLADSAAIRMDQHANVLKSYFTPKLAVNSIVAHFK